MARSEPSELERRDIEYARQMLGLGRRPYPVPGDGEPKFQPTKEERRAKAQKNAVRIANQNQADPFRNETGGILRRAINPSAKDISDSEYEQRVAAFSKPAAPTPAPTPAAAPTLAAAPTPVFPYEQQVAALQAAGGVANDPAGVAPTPGTTAYRQELPDPTGNDNRVRMTVPGKGYAEFQRGSGIDDASVFRGARGGNIRVGARTDAEAARALQARAEQDAASQAEVQRMNRATEMLRDNRAAQMGLSRAVLDAEEGYASTVAPADAPYAQVQRAAERFARSAQTEGDKVLYESEVAVAEAKLKERQAQADRQATLQNTQATQTGALLREQLQQEAARERTTVEALNEDFKAGAEYLGKLTTPDGKNPPQLDPVDVKTYLDQLDPKVAAQNWKMDPRIIERWRSGLIRPHEVEYLKQQVINWKRQQPTGFFITSERGACYAVPPVRRRHV